MNFALWYGNKPNNARKWNVMVSIRMWCINSYICISDSQLVSWAICEKLRGVGFFRGDITKGWLSDFKSQSFCPLTSSLVHAYGLKCYLLATFSALCLPACGHSLYYEVLRLTLWKWNFQIDSSISCIGFDVLSQHYKITKENGKFWDFTFNNNGLVWYQ